MDGLQQTTMGAGGRDYWQQTTIDVSSETLRGW